MPTPEELAHQNIDKQLTTCGWVIQNLARLNRFASLGVAVREFPLQTGEADYLLFVDGKAVGGVEAKPEGTTLSGVAEQAGSYVAGLPAAIPHVTLPLPFQYESTGVETLYRDNRDPSLRSRRIFAFHRPAGRCSQRGKSWYLFVMNIISSRFFRDLFQQGLLVILDGDAIAAHC